MRINLKYKEDCYVDCLTNNKFAEDKDREWFISAIKYYQVLLCKVNVYIEFYNRFYAHMTASKTALTAIFLESFCRTITYIVYKLFGRSNKNSILKFKNDINKLYNKNAVDFKSELNFTKEEQEIIDVVLNVRNKVYGHSDDESYNVSHIDALMSKINIDDVKLVMNRCMNFINDLWKKFCDHEISFMLEDMDKLSSTLKKILKII